MGPGVDTRGFDTETVRRVVCCTVVLGFEVINAVEDSSLVVNVGLLVVVGLCVVVIVDVGKYEFLVDTGVKGLFVAGGVNASSFFVNGGK